MLPALGWSMFVTLSSVGIAMQEPPAQVEESSPAETFTQSSPSLFPALVGSLTSDLVPDSIAAKTTSTAPADAFTDRVGDAIADFLPLFQFAIDSVSTTDDRSALTIKFNSLQLASALNAATQVTLAEPEVYKPLADEIAESVRSAETERLLDEAGDLADVTASVHLALVRGAECAADERAAFACWRSTKGMRGRQYSLYEPLVLELVESLWQQVSTEFTGAEDSMAIASFKAANLLTACGAIREGQVVGVTPETVDTLVSNAREGALATRCREELAATLAQRQEARAVLDSAFRKLNVDSLSALIDNQPQLVFTGSYRFADDVVGPESWSVGTQYEHGRHNFNSLLRATRGGETPYQTYRRFTEEHAEEIGNEQKLVLGITFTRRASYAVEHAVETPAVDPPAPDPSALVRVDLPESDEWKGKLVYTRFIGEGSEAPIRSELLEVLPPSIRDQISTAQERPRISLSIEFIEVDDDPVRQDRLVGRLSYVLPLKGGLTLPVTVTYANRSEFLGEQDEVFAGHVGVSYGFDRKQ